MQKQIIISLILCVFSLSKAAGQISSTSVELEIGPVWQSMNDVQIPNDPTGTRFSLSELAENGPWLSARMYLSIQLRPKHELRLLAAPLTIKENAILEDTINFAGETFVGGPVTAEYTFNSYRFTYQYLFHEQRWKLWVGVTAKIRDALIEFNQNGNSGKKTDLGFVPLLHFSGEYLSNSRLGFLFDIDALAGGPGRAIDLALKPYYDLNDRLRIAVGYRTVEGGADVEDVYTFAWLHYAILSLTYRF